MLQGVFTAIITPFNQDGSIDEKALRELIDVQIKAGISGIVPCGTTGESPTLSHEEHDRVIEITVDQVNKRCEVIAGTGSNSTAEAIRLTKHAEEVGVTASLQVSPYYNKPTQKGLYQHFKAVAEEVNIPLVIYNIKGRTGINIETSTLAELAKIKNIVSVKEASGSLDQMMQVIGAVPDDFSVLSGDDNLVLPLMAAGGQGVISVASNLVPELMVKYVNMGLKENYQGMRELYYSKLQQIFKMTFVETNPIPIKKAMALKGLCQSVYRLPLCEPESASIEKIKSVVDKL
ncbi:MAG: 4-hydroxy-tetrahydrodipicolinate synthase [Spirochaetes bacterium]|nr:4-hydroxy-tetrahydrodipicolinate synthase [Spirochaetota bacterium]